MDGLILATMLSGLMLVAIGLLRLGTFIKFIPYPVTVGFTAGIAVIIFASQLKDLLGLTLNGPEPGPLLQKIPILWSGLATFEPATFALAFATIATITAFKKFRPHWPGMLIAVAGAAAATAAFNIPVSTIGTQFGGIPNSLPFPGLPDISLAKAQAVLPSAVAFALLGSIESLLSAVVADGMTGRRHRSNCELVGQGIANVASALFGGFCVTGTIARTATNVRSGAHGPVAGMLHSVFLLLFVLIAAPLASFIPLASLAGVLAVVAWNMIEKHAFAMLLRVSVGDAVVLLSTFLLTVFRDLTEAIVVGFALGSVLFIYRMSKTTSIEAHRSFAVEDQADDSGGSRSRYQGVRPDAEIIVYRISGAFFFGAAASIGSVLESISDPHKVLIIDFASVPFLDSTAANMLESLVRKVRHRGVRVILTGTNHEIRQELFAHGIKPPLVRYVRSIDQALTRSHTEKNTSKPPQPSTVPAH